MRIRPIVFVGLLGMVLACTGCGKQEGSLSSDSIDTNVSEVQVESIIQEEVALESEIEAASAGIITEEESVVPGDPVENTIPEVEPADADFVRVQDYAPGIFVDLKYATEDNFTGVVIYDFTDAYLRYGTVKKLMAVQQEMESQGLALKIWDAYRPVYAQERLWEVYPDPTYVANPANGITSHSRGDTIDITIVCIDGTEIEMPTGFDDFSTRADRDYSECTEEATNNALLLQQTMYAHGFTGYRGEWWDFSDENQYWDGMSFQPNAQ